MNTFQFGVASIIDSNTGYGLPHSTVETVTPAGRSVSGRSRSRRISDYLVRVRSGISAARIVLRQRRELKKSLRQIGLLSDRMLEDIGLTRGDVIAAQNGLMDRQQLEEQRILNRGDGRVLLHEASGAPSDLEDRKAVNEALFARAKCA
jgi:uncharacterized protein YjiS (DUF1127 family)